MKPLTVAVVLAAVLGVFLVLHLVQYGQIRELETRLARFEKTTTKALASHLIALEATLSHQRVLEQIFMHSAELRLTFERIENYNARTRPHDYTTAHGGRDAQTKKLLQTEPVQRSALFGTGAWEEIVPVHAPSP